MFLPEQWREACAVNAQGMLDPNLTLAHITHNTAVGLLHQGIAYPSPEWQASPIRLPSVSSAETCVAAATEVAIIADKYLQDSTSLINPQFSFCLFISGRMLLAHSLHYSVVLPQEFESLINSLREISRRWNGPHMNEGSDKRTENLASKFAYRLAQAREQGPHTLDIRQAAYSEEHNQESIDHAPQYISTRSNQLRDHESLADNRAMDPSIGNDHVFNNNNYFMAEQDSPESISLAFPPLPLAFQPHCPSATQTRMPSPTPQNQQANGYYNMPGGEAYPGPDYANQNMGYGMSGVGVDDLNSFFEYSFLPNQRISIFSGQNEKEVEQQR